MSTIVQVSKGGRMVIPAGIRKKLNLKEGTRMVLEVQGNSFRVSPLDAAIDALQDKAAILLRGMPSLADELIRERRGEAAREFNGTGNG